MPKQAITMGIGSIMKAKEIMMVATGKVKAEAIRKMVKGDGPEMLGVCFTASSKSYSIP